MYYDVTRIATKKKTEKKEIRKICNLLQKRYPPAILEKYREFQ